MPLKLYHCHNARSLRPLWTIEEMGLECELVKLPFPPRVHAKEYLQVNPLGTVPTLIDGDVHMTESAAICHYLVERYGPTPLAVRPDERDWPDYLNWLYRADATLTFPQTVVLRYGRFEPEERRLPQAAEDYSRWFWARARSVESALSDREYLCAGRFTIADICIGYALFLAQRIGLGDGLKERTRAYLGRLTERDTFRRIQERQADMEPVL
ncbi:MAG: glutathione S-transferase family protein [Burkholderiales bacterium]|nr:MAG: glutathione S-transferase family protein [Burkholderiales bacterium]